MLGCTHHGLQARSAAAVAILCAAFGVVAATPAGRHGGGAARARNTVTIVAAGDVLLDRGVRKAIEGGVETLLSGAKQLFSEADIGLVNLECPATTTAAPAAKRFVFRAEPEWLGPLREAGITDLSLANNHTLDQGPEGLGDTIDAALGAGLGVVVVSFHWGREYSSEPSPAQVDLARRACDWGADLVIGHHPHVMQGIEVYHPTGGPPGRTSLIAYSLGNFVFDQGGVQAGVVDAACTNDTFALKVEVGEAGLLRAEVIPVVIEDCSPVTAEGEDATRVLQRITAFSRALGTSIAPDGLVRTPAVQQGS